MQVHLAEFIKGTSAGNTAEQILRKCVHCGFCTATCPTYQLLGDELDGPRGRIYLIKQVLEGNSVTSHTQRHLDRCLTCRSCETTCPSGVRYAKLLEIGREAVEQRVDRPLLQRILRGGLRWLLPYPRRFRTLLWLGRLMRPVLPKSLRSKVPPERPTPTWQAPAHSRHMLSLSGCVQSVVAPDIDASASRVLHRLGISLNQAPGSGCCGAVSLHLGAVEEARGFARRNIDAWWPSIEHGADAIVASSSACACALREYDELLADDPTYADKAKKVAALAKDLTQVFAKENLGGLADTGENHPPIAMHAPCTLTHGLQAAGSLAAILTAVGYKLSPVADAHLCCGSAGTYSILESELSQRLLTNKLTALTATDPALIVTANIGCLLHLQSRSPLPVKHWIELLDTGFEGA